VIDAAVWIGYAWADEPRCSAAVVVTGTDPDVVEREARSLADRYWNARADFTFSVPTGDADWCIAAGLAATERPYFISDSGDNPTAGGAGDVAYMLERCSHIRTSPPVARPRSGRASSIPMRWLDAPAPEKAPTSTSWSVVRSGRRTGKCASEEESRACFEEILSAATSPSWSRVVFVRS
jgi:hypothetical protein